MSRRITTTLKKHFNRYQFMLAFLSIIAATAFSLTPSQVSALTPQITFPVLGGGWYMNDFSAYRSLNGRHGATDIFSKKHTPLLAAADGYVSYVANPQPSYGWYIQLTDDNGYQYNYIHIDNDTPGTDDGMGGPMNAYAPDMKVGNRVNKGQVIGYMGDSGNAENTPAHLHFEIYGPTDNLINPYEHLREAPIIYSVNKSDYVIQNNEFLPYGMNQLGVNVTLGDVNNDQEDEIITGAGAPGGPHVKVFKKNGEYTGNNFFAYNSAFTGGVDVAVGDVDGDGIKEVITGAGPGGGPHVRAVKLDGREVSSFAAYDGRFSGGVFVAAGDVDGDGVDEIITGAGAGGGPHVRVFRKDGSIVANFFPYAGGFTGGVDVAAGDVNGDGKDEIVTAAGPGAGPHVRVVSYNPSTDSFTPVSDFAAYDGFNGGVRVSVGNMIKSSANDKTKEILTVPASHGAPHSRIFSGQGQVLRNNAFLEQWWAGPYDAAAGNESSFVGVGTNRRASIRPAF